MNDRVDGLNISEYVTVFGRKTNGKVILVANIDGDQEALWIEWRKDFKAAVIKSVVKKLEESHLSCVGKPCTHEDDIENIKSSW